MLENDFHISSVQPIEPPSESAAGEWHSYVIVQGSNTIRGYREGNLRAVTKAAEAIVAQLNERRMGKRARAQLVIAKKETKS